MQKPSGQQEQTWRQAFGDSLPAVLDKTRQSLKRRMGAVLGWSGVEAPPAAQQASDAPQVFDRQPRDRGDNEYRGLVRVVKSRMPSELESYGGLMESAAEVRAIATGHEQNADAATNEHDLAMQTHLAAQHAMYSRHQREAAAGIMRSNAIDAFETLHELHTDHLHFHGSKQAQETLGVVSSLISPVGATADMHDAIAAAVAPLSLDERQQVTEASYGNILASMAQFLATDGTTIQAASARVDGYLSALGMRREATGPDDVDSIEFMSVYMASALTPELTVLAQRAEQPLYLAPGQ